MINLKYLPECLIITS